MNRDSVVEAGGFRGWHGGAPAWHVDTARCQERGQCCRDGRGLGHVLGRDEVDLGRGLGRGYSDDVGRGLRVQGRWCGGTPMAAWHVDAARCQE
jgi:hypothetical protein